MHRPEDDKILPETKIVSALVLPFLLVAFGLLYFWPDDTARLFAWEINPRMTSLLMGAGYLSGLYFFARALTQSSWRRVAAGFLAISAYTWPIALATLLHWDRFNHAHISFWAWTALYALTPLLVPALWLRNRPVGPGDLEPGDLVVPRPLRLAIGAAGLLQLLLALLMFLFPALAIDRWPWQLTPLTARVLAGWFALPGVGGLALAWEARWSGWRVVLESSLLWGALLLLGVWRAWADFDPARPATWLFIGGFGLLIPAALALYLAMENRRRQRASRPAREDPARSAKEVQEG